MARRPRHLVWAVAGTVFLAMGAGHAAAQAQEPGPETPEYGRIAVADRLTGASLTHRARHRALHREIRALVEVPDREMRALNEAIAVLESTTPDPEAAASAASMVDVCDRELARYERWLWGEVAPNRPGLTRAVVQDIIRALGHERRYAALLVQAHAVDDPADRSRMRAECLAAIQTQREHVKRLTRPAQDELEALHALAAELAEPFEDALSAFARVGAVGPVVVESTDAGAWFKDRMVSYRWMDTDGRLVATAQVRLLPSADRDPEPPLLLDRFAIDTQTAQEARVSVGHFTIVFRVAVPELAGEQQVLEALTRLLDLDALSRVRPMPGDANQN